MNRFHIGDTVRLDGVFEQTDEDGELVPYDPSPAPVLTLRHPASGTTHTPAVVRDDVGMYHADQTVGHAGRWGYRWTTAGAQPAADEGSFSVEYSSMG
jgi:hypothetical protein